MSRDTPPSTLALCVQSVTASSSVAVAPPDRREVRGKPATTAPTVDLTIYGCGPDEADLFRHRAHDFGVRPTITDHPLSQDNIALALGKRCISVGHKSRVTKSTLLGLSRAGVGHISTRSIGDDHIDVRFAQSVGISVGRIDYSPDSVADYTLMLILMLLRDARSTVSRAQAYDYRHHRAPGGELRDMTVGVVGTGRIGGAVVDRLRGFGCPVLAYDRCPGASVDHVPLDSLFERSDIVTFHMPLSADTHHMLNRERIERMRPGAFVINTARGALVETEALVQTLERGDLGGAALDVLEGEEQIFYAEHTQESMANRLALRLQQLPNVIITPHTGYYTAHALRDIVEGTLADCLRFQGGGAQ